MAANRPYRSRRRRTTVRAALVTALLLVGATSQAAAHDLDHPAPAFAPTVPVGGTLNAGGPGAFWRLLTTVPTGNPHTDVDFFTQDGETYMAAGTLAVGPNGGGQTIVRLTDNGEVMPSSPEFVSAHPSATCVSDPVACPYRRARRARCSACRGRPRTR